MELKKFSIGASAAIITSMGLIAGLIGEANNKMAVVTGLLIIAIADNISDSFSIHIYKESEGASKKEVYLSTFGNFTLRLLVVLSFILIIFLFPGYSAFIISSIWGLILLAVLSFLIAKDKELNPVKHVAWHLLMALAVIIGSNFIGNFITEIVTK